jgi:FixJ family two-component response regulator
MQSDLVSAYKATEYVAHGNGWVVVIRIGHHSLVVDRLLARMHACLLLDIHLGGISGIELQHRLAASGSKCPVIFMTASDDEATLNEAVNAGCIAYLRKPFARHVLLDAIAKAAA